MFLSRKHRRSIWLMTIVALTWGVVVVWAWEETPHHDTRLQHSDALCEKLQYMSEPTMCDASITETLPAGIHTRSVDDKGQNINLNTSKKIPKVYIYSLPTRFNKDIETCVNYDVQPYLCLHLQNGGLGKFIYREGEMGVFYTNQFSLEVIIHNQLLQSRYRTLNPEEADVYYIPAYLGIYFFCRWSTSMVQLQNEMFDILDAMPYLRQGKPHISTLAKIEREQATSDHPFLQNEKCRDVTYLVIEKEASVWYRKFLGLENQRVIVAPYPSYVHLYNAKTTSQSISSPGLGSRQVMIFVAASDRRTNFFRNIILDQMPHKVVDTTYEKFVAQMQAQGRDVPTQVILTTIECRPGHENITIGWMQKSVFCLQPPGDSPTRKSFYDSIQSGCIPVIFGFADQNVEYPFQRVLNYTDFIVTIDSERIERQEQIRDILEEIPKDEVHRLHQNVLKVAKMLQYSATESGASDQPRSYRDALDMIMEEVQHMYNI
ncbi:probable xyloglucan galactosyltransferase GT19 [Haliotis rubra]|uniref:probable xyloglucan galactosyltransferase GT19 n=1 Tax=Haliotis rubra TaxID=36100 RepID=UPI001EE55197|nr:probable xyloglucan galactosyltransferase GT19 [Haliotis rubra]XP_046563647.1 probable xyloglucan galactosyltransferase GT19 [Haliotis rubra]XP_046563654.1 probable xyloglucan galactosyltransferase GT19 [Haliotis rubra]